MRWALVAACLVIASSASAQDAGRDGGRRDAGIARDAGRTTARRIRSSQLRAIGERFLAAGDAASATAYFREAVAADPDDPLAYEGLGRVYLVRNDPRDALEAFEAGVRRIPDHAGLLLGLARTLSMLGREADAASVLRELIARQPENVEALASAADLARRRHAFAEALGRYRAIRDVAARGGAVEPTVLEEARRYESALTLLVGDLDPVTHECHSSMVRRALCTRSSPRTVSSGPRRR